jgi:hypothetical protein
MYAAATCCSSLECPAQIVKHRIVQERCAVVIKGSAVSIRVARGLRERYNVCEARGGSMLMGKVVRCDMLHVNVMFFVGT